MLKKTHTKSVERIGLEGAATGSRSKLKSMVNKRRFKNEKSSIANVFKSQNTAPAEKLKNQIKKM